MQFFLISDNVDTQLGMRLAGIDGVVVHEAQEVKEALEKEVEDPQLSIILITDRLLTLVQDYVYDLKLNRKEPLIVEIPDRHGAGRARGAITKYIQDAIGLKIE